jgi:hypothetical protein
VGDDYGSDLDSLLVEFLLGGVWFGWFLMEGLEMGMWVRMLTSMPKREMTVSCDESFYTTK